MILSSSAGVHYRTNNTLEDVYIQSVSASPLFDGILVGANHAASNNVFFNIRGTELKNVIHISAANSTSDITILGVTNSGGTNSIEDDLTTPQTQLTDANVAMYIVGEQVTANGSNIGYSRFTTSHSVPTWLVGSSSPTGSCNIGSLYSETAGTFTLGGCRGTSPTWHDIN